MVWIAVIAYITFIPWVKWYSLPILLNPITKSINISFFSPNTLLQHCLEKRKKKRGETKFRTWVWGRLLSLENLCIKIAHLISNFLSHWHFSRSLQWMSEPIWCVMLHWGTLGTKHITTYRKNSQQCPLYSATIQIPLICRAATALKCCFPITVLNYKIF